MKIEDLKTQLNYFIDNVDNITARVHIQLKGNSELFNLNIGDDAEKKLRSSFIDEILTIVNNEEFTVFDLSSADERLNVIYRYDLDEIPEKLTKINTLLDVNTRRDDFNVKDNKISEVDSIVVLLGNEEKQLTVYKKMYSVNLFNAKKICYIVKSKDKFNLMEDDFIRLTPNFQIFNLNGEFFVLDLKVIEKFFGFDAIIKKEAKKGFDAIEGINILNNPEVLRELIDDVSFARKITKVTKSSPLLKENIPNEKIIEFCKVHNSLKGKIKLMDDKIILDTKVSKDLFIKLLMDDFLVSELTQFHYSSVAKDKAEKEEQEAA